MTRISTGALIACSVVDIGPGGNEHIVFATVGTYAGLRAVFVRHYAGNMIEIRVPGGLIVVDKKDFLI
jgi:hypothetical protein